MGSAPPALQSAAGIFKKSRKPMALMALMALLKEIVLHVMIATWCDSEALQYLLN